MQQKIFLVVVVILFMSRTGIAGELPVHASKSGVTELPAPIRSTENRAWDPALLQQAEGKYLAGQYDSALQSFGMIAAMYRHPFAWLRVGNIWHRRGDISQALTAYKKGQQLAGADPRYQSVGDRAAMNLALISLEQAGAAMNRLARDAEYRTSAHWRDEMQRRLAELRGVLSAHPGNDFADTPSRHSSGAGAPSDPRAEVAAFGRFAPE